MNSSCILVLLVAYYINNIIICGLGIGTCCVSPVFHWLLQHWYCSNTSALLRSVSLLKHLSNKSSHVAAITSHISLFIHKLQQNQHKKILRYSAPAGSPLWEQEPMLVLHTKFLLQSFPTKIFSQPDRGVRPHRTRVPNIFFHCASFLWKSLQSLAKIPPHSLGRAFYSPDELSTNSYHPFRSC